MRVSMLWALCSIWLLVLLTLRTKPLARLVCRPGAFGLSSAMISHRASWKPAAFSLPALPASRVEAYDSEYSSRMKPARVVPKMPSRLLVA
jgi:hypothetical protein